ncbi:MAG: chlorophyll synthase ChlG [Halieaceae bacterium]|jgi:chlorophyll synthase|nr:chlorophyll synthase ChlG [Halieaceae bacterium]
MHTVTPSNAVSTRPQLNGFVALLKPITWFPPMWAFLCGAVSAGSTLIDRPLLIIGGILLTGPLVCGASQVINDWCDREVDAINEPNRPIPSGRVSPTAALWFAVLWSALAMLWGSVLGTTVAIATAAGLFLAWAYSAPPLRLKRNGWWGNAAVGISYEGLAWVTGAAVFVGGTLPGTEILLLALLYSIGAHGIMTLNDFKSVKGDRELGLKSLPAALGVGTAARLACLVMALPQMLVIGLLLHWSGTVTWHVAILLALLVLQALAMLKLLKDPEKLAPWYNGTGVTAYVSGMMVAAAALAQMGV